MAKNTGIVGWLTRPFRRGGPLVPVVRLQGVIAAEQRSGRLSIQTVAPLLQRAFEMGGSTVAIVVNSPGGSPVQSRLIAKRIRDLAAERVRPTAVRSRVSTLARSPTPLIAMFSAARAAMAGSDSTRVA